MVEKEKKVFQFIKGNNRGLCRWWREGKGKKKKQVR
jgi:hypothetical protein